jgi:ABC-2 type transport system permease protein
VNPDGRSLEAIRLELPGSRAQGGAVRLRRVPEGHRGSGRAPKIRITRTTRRTALPDWLRATTNRRRPRGALRAASIDQALVTRLTRQVGGEPRLFERDERGGTRAAKAVDPISTFGIPAAMLVLMYMTVMASAPQLLNSVIEEKMSRISEVLIASVTPFELMMGKLIGSAGVSLVLAATYVAGGLGIAGYWGYASAVPPALLLWFLLFVLMAVFIFGAIFIAIGAACTDLKDSQNMMGPVMLIVMSPMFVWFAILRNPDTRSQSCCRSYPRVAFLMLLRTASTGPPPADPLSVAVSTTMVSCLPPAHLPNRPLVWEERRSRK